MKILYLQENNKIALVSPNPQIPIETVLEGLPKSIPMIMVDDDKLPNSDDLLEFFDALTVDFSNSNIGFNLEIAKEITKKRLRKEREQLFPAVDLAIRDAMIENDTVKLDLAIAERNRLRDITKLADQANDLSALRAIHP
jgi:hypothetical protein